MLYWEHLQGRNGHEAGLALLKKCCGGALPEILRTPRGKPYFPEGNVHFSISHTKSHVFCALSSTPVGVDAEELDRQVNPALADKILSPMEMEQYLRAEDKSRALLTFWVLKEAAAKCTGEGLRGYPNHTAFSLDDPRVRVIDGCLVAVIEEENEHVI